MIFTVRKILSIRSVVLLILDIGSFVAAYYLTVVVQQEKLIFNFFAMPPYFYASLFIFPFSYYLFDLYYPFKIFERSRMIVDIVMATLIGMLAIAALSYLDRTFILGRYTYIYSGIFIMITTYSMRRIYERFSKAHFLEKRTLVVGTGQIARELAQAIKDTPYSGMDIIGCVSESVRPAKRVSQNLPVLGNKKDVVSLIEKHRVDLVLLALDAKDESVELHLMSDLLQRQVMVSSAIHVYENMFGEIPYQFLGNYYLLQLMTHVKRNSYLRVKRMMDILGGLLLLILSSPIVFVAVATLYCISPGKIFFVQKRVGKNGREFKLLKLRSMTDANKNKQKITKVGQWLRRYRIDEIPQLINVLKGDMSLIGPRPEVPYFVNRSRKRIPFYDVVFAVKPGLTGWAQIKFDHVTSTKDYEKKFRYNLYYLNQLSISFDLIILLKTIRVVLLGKGK